MGRTRLALIVFVLAGCTTGRYELLRTEPVETSQAAFLAGAAKGTYGVSDYQPDAERAKDQAHVRVIHDYAGRLRARAGTKAARAPKGHFENLAQDLISGERIHLATYRDTESGHDVHRATAVLTFNEAEADRRLADLSRDLLQNEARDLLKETR